jgi:hypothetical protein
MSRVGIPRSGRRGDLGSKKPGNLKFFVTSAQKFRRRIMEKQLPLLLLDSG